MLETGSGGVRARRKRDKGVHDRESKRLRKTERDQETESKKAWGGTHLAVHLAVEAGDDIRGW